MCSEDKCNGIDLANPVDDGLYGLWQDLPLQCYTCSDKECEGNLGKVVKCSENRPKQNCMTVFDSTDTVRHRGCSDNLRDLWDLYCRQNPEYCFECKSNQCNVAWKRSDYHDCVFCNSEQDARCSILPNSNDLATRKCKGDCMITMIDDGKQLIRSCLDDKELQDQGLCKSNNNVNCTSCEGDACNTNLYPEDRLQCYHCDSMESCQNRQLQYCVNYNIYDQCFAKYSNNQIEKMGCVSAVNSETLSEWNSQYELFTCEGNACNKDIPVIQPEHCVECNSRTDPKCAQNVEEIKTRQSCPYSIGKCITKYTEEGYTIRECLKPNQDNAEECEKNGKCSTCNTNDCNNKVISRLFLYQIVVRFNLLRL